ncbi:MAG: hypothetical protein R3264_07760, partial [Anaerolineae bacterium]|nr:hypothetical protein [Anaerolineae bacterium]
MSENDNNDIEAIDERDPRLLRRILLGAVAAVLVCLMGYLAFTILTADEGDIAGEPPSPTATSAEGDAGDEGDSNNTPTPTRVIDETTPTPTEAADEPTATPTPTTAPTVVAKPPDESQDTLVSFEPGPAEEIIKNGGFDEGFASNGVALEWTPFKNDEVIAAYAAEAPDSVYIADGQSAQRIALSQAKLGNRYAGIYQQLDVIEGETYTLSMKGQIRTGVGDVDKTSYGYRMQYAISQRGVRNWEVVPDEAWIELPWDEQMLGDAETEFFEYETEIVPQADQITLFIRAWNKWP